jgi:hypothetical protein
LASGGGVGSGSTLPDLFLVSDFITSTPPGPPITPPFIPPFVPPITPPVVVVPETSTWIMLIAGLVGISFLKWRRT